MTVELLLQLIILLIFITWAVIMMAIVKTMSYFKKFESFKDRNDTELNVIAGYMKKINEQMIVATNELKRTNRLFADLTKYRRSPGVDDIKYVDDGIFRDFPHEKVKVPSKESHQTQPLSERQVNK